MVTVINLNDNPPQFVDESGVPVEIITVPVIEEILPPHVIHTLQVISSQICYNSKILLILMAMTDQ